MKVVEIEGQERLLYKAFPINVVFLRASYADEYGNCTVHREIGPIDVTAMAQACKNSGGRVIVQVEKNRPRRQPGSETGGNSRYLCGFYCGRIH